jgi:GxxExxY protein
MSSAPRKVLVENKTVEKILPIHLAQLLTYLKLSGLFLGLIINWNAISGTACSAWFGTTQRS